MGFTKKKKVNEEVKPKPVPQPMRLMTFNASTCDCGKIQLIGSMEDMQLLYDWREQSR